MGKAYILHTPHTEFLAFLFQEALAQYDVDTVAYQNPPRHWDPGQWYVISPQAHGKLPPKYVAVQVEQAGSRWWTERYVDQLKKAEAVLEIFRPNLDYLLKRGIPRDKIFYLPLQISRRWPIVDAERQDTYPALHYGDHHSPRRQRILEQIDSSLQNGKQVERVIEVYNAKMRRKLAENPVVVNIHYDDNAYLEQVRIFESLSSECVVISEPSPDLGDHLEYLHMVDWVRTPAEMAERIDYYTDQSSLERRIDRNIRTYPTFKRFDYHLGRYLLFTGQITFDQLYQAVGPLPLNRLNTLTLPETPARYEYFLEEVSEKFPHRNFHMLHGLRHRDGWRGSGMSFKYIMKSATARGLNRLTLMEDDVELPPNWDERYSQVLDYLDSLNGEWDVFAGIMAEYNPHANITNVVHRSGIDFIHLDRMVSAVFNIYNVQTLGKRLAKWDEQTDNHLTGQFDRYLEQTPNLRVVTSQPWLVGHAEHLFSTMWHGGNNAKLYNSQISRATTRIRTAVQNWRDTHDR